MLNPFADVDWNPDQRARRKFAVSLVIGFPCIAILLGVATRFASGAWKPFFLWLGAIGWAVGLVLWLLPQISKPFYLGWFAFACCTGFVIGNFLFGAVYYLMITPMGLLRRVINPRAFSKGFDRTRATYWDEARKTVDLKRYYRQF